MNPTTATGAGAGRREWIGLSVLALACIVYAMDITVLNLAVPAISADLRPSSLQLLWISTQPLIDLRLFRNPAFNAALLVYTLGILIVFGSFLFIAQYLQLVLGLSPLQAGLCSLPGSIGLIVGSLVAPIIVRRLRPTLVMAAGLAVGAVGFGLFTLVEAGAGLAFIVAGDVLLSLGLGAVFTLTNDLVIGSVAPERAGAASGISETGAELGGAIGIALLGTLGTAIYRSEMVQAMPTGVPAEGARVARDTLGGALSVSTQLPGDLGSSLLDAARLSFTSAFHAAVVVSAVIAIGLAVFVGIRWRT